MRKRRGVAFEDGVGEMVGWLLSFIYPALVPST
jgi:hypothetical protein